MTNIDEIWLHIPGYDGYYEVSNLGRVRSVDRLIANSLGRTRWYPGRILKEFHPRQPWSYPMVIVGRRPHQKVMKVHSLVLAAFVGPRPEGMVTRHLNGDSTDNRLENLRYGTPSENMLDRNTHGTCHERNKTHCKWGHSFSGDNLRIGTKGQRECRACARAKYHRLKRQRMANTGAKS